MIQQSASQFTQNAKKATSTVDEKLPDRQRGMWSFLTWSFFLAQAVASHEAYAKGAHSADGDADAHAATAGDDGAANKAMADATMSGVQGFDIDPAAAAQFAAALAAGMITPQMLAAFQADPSQFHAFMDAMAAASAPGSEGGYAYELTGASHDDGSAGHAPGIDLPGGIEIPGLDLHGVTLPINVAIDLGLELGSNLGLGLDLGLQDGLHANIDLNVAPILGLGLHIGGDGLQADLGLLGINVALGGENGIGLGNLLSLGGDHGALSGLPLGSAISTVTSLTGMTSDTLDGPLHTVGTIASGLQSAVAPVTASATSLVGDTLHFASSTGLLASGGSIVQSASTLLSASDDLFANGHHTTYGLELQSHSASNAAGHDGAAGSISANAETVDAGAFADHLGHGAGDTVGNALPSVIDELHLRGFGDGIA